MTSISKRNSEPLPARVWISCDYPSLEPAVHSQAVRIMYRATGYLPPETYPALDGAHCKGTTTAMLMRVLVVLAASNMDIILVAHRRDEADYLRHRALSLAARSEAFDSLSLEVMQHRVSAVSGHDAARGGAGTRDRRAVFIDHSWRAVHICEHDWLDSLQATAEYRRETLGIEKGTERQTQ